MYTFPFCRLKNDRITAILSSRLTVLCRFAAKIGCASTKQNKKKHFCFALSSAFTISGFAEGTSFGKVQIYLAFRSLNRTFAPYYNSILTKQRYYGNNSREHE